MTKNNPWLSLCKSVNSKRCNPGHKYDFFWMLGQNNEYMLAINHCRLEDWSPKKFNLSSIAIEQYEVPEGFRLVLKLLDNTDWDLFYNLCQDLQQTTNECSTETEMLTVVFNRLERWQKLFRKAGKKILTPEEQQGLIGELFFIHNHLLPVFTVDEVFEFWKGPYGGQQDFGIGNIAVEIKTKLGTSAPYVQINSIEQLDCNTDQCYLFVLTLNASPSVVPDSFSLNEIVSQIKKTITSLQTLEILECLLTEYGYIEISEYNEPHYLIAKETMYEVKSGFPRLTAENLALGIHSVQYRIELQACKPFEFSIDEFAKKIANE